MHKPLRLIYSMIMFLLTGLFGLTIVLKPSNFNHIQHPIVLGIIFLLASIGMLALMLAQDRFLYKIYLFKFYENNEPSIDRWYYFPTEKRAKQFLIKNNFDLEHADTTIPTKKEDLIYYELVELDLSEGTERMLKNNLFFITSLWMHIREKEILLEKNNQKYN